MSEKQRKELSCKIGLFGLGDLRKLAPIGNLGYANGWYPPCGSDAWMNGGMERAIMAAFREQKDRFGFTVDGHSTGWARTDHHSFCKELGLRWSVDSGG